MHLADAVRRRSDRIQWISIGLIVAGLFALVRRLPIDQWIARLQEWLDGFGFLGVAIFVVIYAVAALLFVPGSALTLAAGALFGLWWGTAAVSVASTTTAALAFLIARYLARGAVERKAAASPRFAAIDRAIGQGGWRIIALLRLSPAVPFSLGNYLYGLTPIPFWPYVASSWIAMLPGTFLYVYLGYVGSEGLSLTGGIGERSRPLGQWILTVVGFVASVVVTVYVTRLARRAVRERTSIDVHSARDASKLEPGQEEGQRGWPWVPTLAMLGALVVLAAAVFAYTETETLQALIGASR